MKILLAIDGSDYTRKMLDYVCANRQLFDPSQTFTLLNTQPPLPPHARGQLGATVVNQYYEDEAKKVIEPAMATLAKAGIPYANQGTPGETVVQIGDEEIRIVDKASFDAALPGLLEAAGYPAKADPAQTDTPLVIAILTVLVIYVTMVYGPIEAALVELFPTRIRYTGMSLPYHIGNGWFGGLLPATSFAMVAGTGDIYYGLWYPIVIAMMTFVIGMLFVPETKDRDILTHDNP